MKWNSHSELNGLHAFLSPSSYHWLNYDREKLESVYQNFKAKEEGVWLHTFASMAITKRIKLAKNKNTLNMFVNDAIGFGMKSEQILYYSPNAFGTTDAISFKQNVLRISDYKSGESKASFKQLDVYAAFFCLEYGINPEEITIILRLYQNNEIDESTPEGSYIRNVMNIVIDNDMVIESLKTNTF